jgi:hypothetical protein
MALTRRGTHRCEKRIGCETQMTRRGRVTPKRCSSASERGVRDAERWSEGTKDERGSSQMRWAGDMRARPTSMDELYPRPVGERGRSPRRLTLGFSGERSESAASSC